MLEVHQKGADELVRKAERFAVLLDREMKRAAFASAVVVAAEAKRRFRPGGYTLGPRGGRVPTPPPQWPHVFNRTGDAHNSITPEVRALDAGPGWTGVVFSEVPYFRRLELGFRGRDRLGRSFDQRPRFILRGALGRKREKIGEIFVDALARARRKAGL